MHKNLQFVRKYPASFLLVITISVLSLIPIVQNPVPSLEITDKWAHCLMYLTLTLCIWTEYLLRNKHPQARHLALWACAAPIIMGGVLEILQATCTGGHRSGEWLDFVANTIGVLTGSAIGMLLVAILSRNRKDD